MWGNVECLPGAGSQRRIADVLNSDSELVERCLSEDEAAWEYLVRQHTGRVYGMCYSFTRRRSDAQDLTQDVFLRVFRRSAASAPPKPPSQAGWSASLATSLSIITGEPATTALPGRSKNTPESKSASGA